MGIPIVEIPMQMHGNFHNRNCLAVNMGSSYIWSSCRLNGCEVLQMDTESQMKHGLTHNEIGGGSTASNQHYLAIKCQSSVHISLNIWWNFTTKTCCNRKSPEVTTREILPCKHHHWVDLMLRLKDPYMNVIHIADKILCNNKTPIIFLLF